jgi:hypothetical protein
MEARVRKMARGRLTHRRSGLTRLVGHAEAAPSVEAYRQFARRRIDAVNHALAGIPGESVRYHLCWGGWNRPHISSI